MSSRAHLCSIFALPRRLWHHRQHHHFCDLLASDRCFETGDDTYEGRKIRKPLSVDWLVVNRHNDVAHADGQASLGRGPLEERFDLEA